MHIRLSVCAAALLVMSTADASAFSMSFRWCGSGSPVFSLSGVPKGAATLQFHMVDLQVPSYNHGGGTVTYKGQSTVPCGALTNYSPPSPPSGSHSYQITVTAFGPGNANLGTASFTRQFPEKK
ncbi:phospholipid-binding protein [Bradyrhizobium erythrophlei]|uniref:phospholipid-binding protein n=1 Tax=Bradyrhizobium erythrophlei TaxID=1437360 RepID=UPI0035ECA79A